VTPLTAMLVRRIADEGGIAFVAGWALHGVTVRAAFRRDLIREVAPDVWATTAFLDRESKKDRESVRRV